MSEQEQRNRLIGEEPNGDEEAAAIDYEPPTIVRLGSVDQLTAGQPSGE